MNNKISYFFIELWLSVAGAYPLGMIVESAVEARLRRAVHLRQVAKIFHSL